MIRFAIIFLFFWTPITLFSQTNDSLLTNALNYKLYSFISPNELNLEYLAPYSKKIPSGALLSVGTERGFIAFSMFDQFTQLILIDRDPNVAIFNLINIELLKIAQNREEYLDFRKVIFGTNPSRNLKHDSLVKKIVASSHNNISIEHIKHMNQFMFDFETFPLTTEKIDSKFNYLWNDSLFLRLSSAAKASKIRVLNSEFSEISEEILTPLLGSDSISTIDLSNAWHKQYFGIIKSIKLFERLKSFFTKNSIIIYTIKNYQLVKWIYVPFSIEAFLDPDYNELRKDFLIQSRINKMANKSFLPNDIFFFKNNQIQCHELFEKHEIW